MARTKNKIVSPALKSYTAAGVDVDLGNSLKSTIQKHVSSTHGPAVLGKIGGFGGFFQASFPGMKDPVLVASIDGVGTKLKLAFPTGAHRGVAQDLVNHCVNDIAVTGARPLFFLDYLGAGSLQPTVFGELMAGFAKACRENDCALIGGETAQMPGIYQQDEYDLAGCIVGVADRSKIWDGQNIRPGDVVLGVPSNGLHTNGYSLARKVFFEQKRYAMTRRLPGLSRPLGEELLRVHKSYWGFFKTLKYSDIKAAAHITGGGLIDNMPRILPVGVDVEIDPTAWSTPAIFEHIQKLGKVDPAEMYQVFNMGIGLALICTPAKAERLKVDLKLKKIGQIVPGTGTCRILGVTG